jgi:hypothetical protein
MSRAQGGERAVGEAIQIPPPVAVPLADLKPHPRNYREHPADQVQHIAESIRANGFYRNIVAARDLTILAGHGVAKAAGYLGMESVPVVRLDLDPEDPRALKVLTGDNEIEHLAEQDDRLLSELLKEISQTDAGGLLGTGYDEMMLANLAFVSRPASEVKDFDEAAAWAGMPSYDEGGGPAFKLIVTFPTEADRERFAAEKDVRIDKHEGKTWTTRWPFTEREDLASLRFEGAEA